jgi:8-oxo-dGTP pyrophosphatase MutT (NUDIX family)
MSDPLRVELRALLAGVAPWDDAERADLDTVAAWLGRGAPLYRTEPPDVPPMHLVSYFVPRAADGRLLFVAHRKAGLWLPPGGHVEPGESPWRAVEREYREELGVPALPTAQFGTRPLFVTVTETRGAGRHTDVSLWHLVAVADAELGWFDPGEFSAVRWQTPAEVLATPLETLDPQAHRFVRKLLAAPRYVEPGPAY